MTNQEAIEELQLTIDLIKQNGKDWLDERDIPILSMAIEAMKELNALREQNSPSQMSGTSDFIDRKTLKEKMIKYGFTAPDMTVTEFVEDFCRGGRNMTYGEMFKRCTDTIRNEKIDDYRPNEEMHVKDLNDRCGIRLWFNNGDSAIYYPSPESFKDSDKGQ